VNQQHSLLKGGLRFCQLGGRGKMQFSKYTAESYLLLFSLVRAIMARAKEQVRPWPPFKPLKRY
jgi:hypothetical protein